MAAPVPARRVLGIVLEIRLLPVVMWSFTALTLGTAVGAMAGDGLHPGRYVVAVIIGVLVQGLVAHTVNDIADWRSGTDRHPSPRTITGGSKVLPLGLMSTRELRWVGWCAGLAAVGLGVLLAQRYGWELAWFGVVGLTGAVIYTLAPARAAYRPVLGEVVAFVCMAACVIGAARLQTPTVPGLVVAVAAAHSAACVAMLLVHHLPDREADLAAQPVKRTTPTLIGARHPWYAAGWALLSGAAALWLSLAVDPAYWPLVAAALATLIAVGATRNDSPRALLLAEIAIMLAVTAAGIAAATMLMPSLAPALLIPPVAIAVELAVSRLARPASPDHAGL